MKEPPRMTRQSALRRRAKRRLPERLLAYRRRQAVADRRQNRPRPQRITAAGKRPPVDWGPVIEELVEHALDQERFRKAICKPEGAPPPRA